jgi:hypothetical protein
MRSRRRLPQSKRPTPTPPPSAPLSAAHGGDSGKSKRASAGGALPPMARSDDDDFDSAAAALAKKRVKKSRASAGGAAGESVGRLERQLLAACKRRATDLVKLVQFYRERSTERRRGDDRAEPSRRRHRQPAPAHRVGAQVSASPHDFGND